MRGLYGKPLEASRNELIVPERETGSVGDQKRNPGITISDSGVYVLELKEAFPFWHKYPLEE
jgi:hypothetical protein